jgi:site-specific recombinase XerD
MTQTGLRVTETTALTIGDVQLARPGAHVNIAHGKGRKQRGVPVSATVTAVLGEWLRERQGQPDDPMFPSSRRTSLSRDSIAHLVTKHAATAAATQPSIATKNVTPHTLRHTCAMALLQAGVDTTVIALWLGHETIETTQIYIHADMTTKEEALDRTTPPNTSPGRYQADTSTLAFLKNL